MLFHSGRLFVRQIFLRLTLRFRDFLLSIGELLLGLLHVVQGLLRVFFFARFTGLLLFGRRLFGRFARLLGLKPLELPSNSAGLFRQAFLFFGQALQFAFASGFITD